MAGIYEAQKMHDAYNKSTKNTGDELSAFENNSHTQSYIDQLTPEKIDEQIALLEKPSYQNISNHSQILASLKQLKLDLNTLQNRTRAASQALQERVIMPRVTSTEKLTGAEQIFSDIQYTINGNKMAVIKVAEDTDAQTMLVSLADAITLYFKKSNGTWGLDPGGTSRLYEVESIDPENSKSIKLRNKSQASSTTLKQSSVASLPITNKPDQEPKTSHTTTPSPRPVQTSTNTPVPAIPTVPARTTPAPASAPASTKEKASGLPRGFSFAAGFPEGDKEEFMNELSPFMDPKKIQIEGVTGITVKKVEGVKNDDVFLATVTLSNNERIWVNKKNEDYTLWTPGLNMQIQIGVTIYNIELGNNNRIRLGKVIDLKQNAKGKDILRGYTVRGDDNAQLYFTPTEGIIGYGLAHFDWSQDSQNILVGNPTKEKLVKINKTSKIIIISNSPRQQLVDELNNEGQTSELGKSVDTIKIGNHEVTVNQAKIIAHYYDKPVDIGDGKKEAIARLNVKVTGEKKFQISGKDNSEEFVFRLNINANTVESYECKNPSPIAGRFLTVSKLTPKQQELITEISRWF